jgi:O-antigen ligase
MLVRNRDKILLVIAAALTSMGQALTGGRTGYVTWGAIGFILCVVRWRKFLPIIPITVILIITLFPPVRERMLMGIGKKSKLENQKLDTYTMTSGRSIIWPYVIEKIKRNPIFGYGRLAMKRTGLAFFLMADLNESFPHPHNAYFELLLDTGIVGFMFVMPFYVIVMTNSIRLLLIKDNLIYTSIGGVAVSLVLALLISSVGSQSFYPREGFVGMWASIGIMFRASKYLDIKWYTGIDYLDASYEEARIDGKETMASS